MKQLSEFTDREALKYPLASKTLSRRFDEYITECEMDYIAEKLDCFPSGCTDYNIGVYDRNYIKVKDASDFLDGVQRCAKHFGCTERLEALINQCNALKYKNLFAYMVGKLAKVFFEEEIKQTIEYLEECSYAIHCEDAKNCLIDHVECFVDCRCDNVYIDDNNELIEIVKL
jgi:hypothetical protein